MGAAQVVAETVIPANWPTRIGDAVAITCVRAAAVALAIIVLINGANVAGRYIMNEAIAWAEELMLYLMVFVVFSACVAVTWRQAHIRIESLVHRLPAAGGQAVETVIALLAAAIMLTVAHAGYDTVAMLLSFDQRSDALKLPIWIPQSFVVGGLALSAGMILLRQVARYCDRTTAGGVS